MTKKERSILASNAQNYFANKETVKELSLDELDNIAGGRQARDSEYALWEKMFNESIAKYCSLMDAGKTEEANALDEAFTNAFIKWDNDIKNAPEGSPDIPFSNYFSL